MEKSIKIIFFLSVMLIVVHGKLSPEGVNRMTTVEPEKADLKPRNISIHGGNCTSRDISISQTAKSTRGIPQYLVEITNLCTSSCGPSNIHLHCGWFSSAIMVDPRIFKRLSYDDCLVNGGSQVKSYQVISFVYATTYQYPLSFKSADFCSAH